MSNLYHDGQEVTVIDAKKRRGPGKMEGSGCVSVQFPHWSHGALERGEINPPGTRWGVCDDGDTGIGVRIEPHPFTEEADDTGGDPTYDLADFVSLCDEDPRDAEIARLREALAHIAGAKPSATKFSKTYIGGFNAAMTWASDIARAALSPDPVEGEG